MAAPALLQQVDTVGTAGTTLVATLAATTAGSTLIVYYGSSAVANGVVSSIAATGGTASKIGQSNVNRDVEAWKVTGVTAGTTSVTVTASVGSQNLNYIRVQEWSGVLSVPLTAGLISNINGSNGAPTTTAVTPASGASVVVCAAARTGGAYSSGPTNSFAAQTNTLWDNVAGAPRDLEGHLAVATPDGTTSYSTAWAVGAGNWEAISFLLVGSGPPSGIITTQPSAKVVSGAVMSNVVFKKTTDGSTIDTSFVGAVTISLVTGTGALTGTVTRNAVAGVATFNDLVVTLAAGPAVNHRLSATDGSVTATTNLFLVGTDGAWTTRMPPDLIVASSDSTADRLTWNGIAWASNNTQSNLPVVTDGSGNVAAGEAYITLSGVDYPITNWDSGGTFVLTGAPHVSGATFSYKYKRRYQFFVPGTLNQVSAPYGLLIWHGGGNSKGKDGVSMMSQAGELPYNIGWPNAGVPNTLTTGIFGTYNWPVATAFIQLAVGNFAAYEGRQLVDAIIADVEANFSIDRTRLYWAGSSYGGYLGLAYVAANASKFAGIILTSAVTGQFYFAKFALGYVGANAAAARAYAAPLLAAARVWFRELTGTLDNTITAADDLTNNVPFDQTAYNAAYAAAGLTSGNERTSDLNIVQDYAPYGGTPWDHIAAYTNSLDETTLFSDMFARTQPLAAAGGGGLTLLRRRRR